MTEDEDEDATFTDVADAFSNQCSDDCFPLPPHPVSHTDSNAYRFMVVERQTVQQTNKEKIKLCVVSRLEPSSSLTAERGILLLVRVIKSNEQ